VPNGSLGFDLLHLEHLGVALATFLDDNTAAATAVLHMNRALTPRHFLNFQITLSRLDGK
jgi:hypothetical protein